MIAALDISLYVGWALQGAEGIAFGSHSFDAYRNDEMRAGGRFRNWVDGFLDEQKPVMLITERPFFRGDCTWLLVGLHWEARRSAFERGIQHRDYAPMTLKKFMTGNGKALKPEMVQAARMRGHNVGNDHEADAVALLLKYAADAQRPIDAPQESLF